jgi:hypothetical protein
MRERSQIHPAKTAVIALLAATLSGAVSLADKLVDPSKVSPEFREAAEKRRAEQLKIIRCNNSLKLANIPARDQVKFLSECIDKPDEPPSDISAATKK